MTLNFKIENQTLRQIGEPKPANKSQEYLELSFEFLTTDWTGLTKFGMFTNQDGLKYRVAIQDNKVIVPNAVLQDEKFTFSIYGVKDDVRVTTNQLTIYLSDSGYVRDVENDIPDDDPTIVEQIYECLDTKSDVGHVHDDRYYTEGETDTLLNGKSDVGHVHDDRYYTEEEVNQIIYGLNNKILIDGDKTIIQTDDVVVLRVFVVKDGMPKKGKTVYFYKIEEE